MADDNYDDEPAPQRRTQPEGVRIIGAEEAAEIVSRRTGEVPVTRRHDDAPPADDADRPALRFPLPDGTSPAERAERFDEDAFRNEPDDTIAMEVGGSAESFELPHYTDPPTGQVPKVVLGEGESRWAGLADTPRWRDTDHQFDEQPGFDDLIDDAPRLGALGETGEHRDLFDLDIPDVAPPPSREHRAVRHDVDELDAGDLAGAGAGVGSASAGVVGDGFTSDDSELDETAPAPAPRPRRDRPAPVAVDDEEIDEPTLRRPPAPRRRRPTGDGPAGGRTAIGADSGGGRNMPMAIGVGLALVALGAAAFAAGAVTTTALIAVVLCLCAAEYFTSLKTAGYRPATLIGIVAVGGLAVAPLYETSFAYPVIFGLTTMAGLAWYLFVHPGEGAVMNLGVTLLGVAYVGGLGSFATLTLGVARAGSPPKLANQGIGVLFAAVLVTVCYDVGAYFIGKQFGRNPLTNVSPNKTQEGLVGGVAVAVLVPFLILWLSSFHPVGVSMGKALGFCLICAVMAPVGDLCESALKRDLGVKDMGTLLPGHGGVLDRFDALLFVLPTAFFMARLLELGKPAVF